MKRLSSILICWGRNWIDDFYIEDHKLIFDAIKTIYDNSNMAWRYSYNSPSDIIVDENAQTIIMAESENTLESADTPDLSNINDENVVSLYAKVTGKSVIVLIKIA